MEITEICKVAPSVGEDSSASPLSTPKSLSLTFFDIRWLRLAPPKLLLFYDLSNPNTNTTAFFDSTILPSLKRSLSLALGLHFAPLAGHLVWPLTSPTPAVSFAGPDAGVSLTVARSAADGTELFGRLARAGAPFEDAEACHPLLPGLRASHGRAEILACQVTLFPGRGLALGVVTQHTVLDARSAFSFMKAWAHICRSLLDHQGDSELPPELRPSFDRALVQDPKNLAEIFSRQWLSVDGPDNRSVVPWEVKATPCSVRGLFRLSREKIETLRRLASSAMSDKIDDDQFISTFTLACAYTWACLAAAEGDIIGEGDERDGEARFLFGVDCRSRLEPPLPEMYFGNCIAPRFVVVERHVLVGERGFFEAVRAIREGTRSARSVGELLGGAENWVSILTGNRGSREGLRRRRRFCVVAGSHKLGIYGTDFGFGRPARVDISSIEGTEGLISLLDSGDGDGGVEIGLVLNKQHMENFAALFHSRALDFESLLKD